MSRPIHFRHLGKTAGTSIYSFLETNALERMWCPLQRRFFLGNHTPWDLRCPDRPDDLLVFGAVRNPEVHIRSLHRQYYDRKQPETLNEWIQTELWALSTPEEMLKDCEFVICFENLTPDWERFCSYASVRHQPLPHHRNQRHIPVSCDAINEKSKRLLREHYAWVYDNYDYKVV